MKIKSIHARWILDSRGTPTTEVDLSTVRGAVTASVPSGASKGKHEAIEIRDNANAFAGKGVNTVVANINNKIAKEIVGMDCYKQREIDEKLIAMDGTSNKSKLGANAILSVSMAVARAAAFSQGIPLYRWIAKLAGSGSKLNLPHPFANVLNGGVHAANELDIQEFMIVPRERDFAESTRIVSETYNSLKKILHEKYGVASTNVGDEGGFAPPIKTTAEALSVLEKAVKVAGYQDRVDLAIDCAASEFFNGKDYLMERQRRTTGQLLEFYNRLLRQHKMVSIEDPFAEDDWQGFTALVKAVGKNIQIVGDDLLVTNPNRIRKAIELRAANCLLLKINQIGTLTEALEAAKLAKANHWRVMVSHRSGETEDDFIADLATGLNTNQIKLGAPCRGERTAKYNRLLRIEEDV